jgi:hypothetical protein
MLVREAAVRGVDPIALVDAAYDRERRADAWMRELLQIALPLLPRSRFGVCYPLDVSNPAAPAFSMPVTVGLPESRAAELLETFRRSDPGAARQIVGTSKVGTLRSQLRGAPASQFGPSVEQAFQAAYDNFGREAEEMTMAPSLRPA